MIFLSYSKQDIDIARKFYNDLIANNIPVWFDEKCINPGQKWKEAIYKAIKECKYFIALLSSNSISKKGYIQKELKIAFEILDEYPTSEIFIIPVRIDECELTDDKIKELHYIDIYSI